MTRDSTRTPNSPEATEVIATGEMAITNIKSKTPKTPKDSQPDPREKSVREIGSIGKRQIQDALRKQEVFTDYHLGVLHVRFRNGNIDVQQFLLNEFQKAQAQVKP